MFELINLCIQTESVIVTGKDDKWWERKLVFQMSGKNDARKVFISFLEKHPEINWTESGEK